MEERPIIDSKYSLAEALGTIDVPAQIKDALCLVEVQYISFDALLHQGQLVVHKNVADEVQEIFAEILEQEFPIKSVVPVSKYGYNDEVSMTANNTSAFNYRPIFGTETVSNHSRGLAIDINPLLNPCTAIDGTIQPATGIYDPTKLGTIRPGDPIVTCFKSRGWRWLGERERKDWQHFDKANIDL